jgi:transcriptional regulator with XRE-family HTH domain
LELGMTQEDLAGAVELDRPYITMLEAGRKQPTLSVLWRIAGGLQLSAGDLAKRVDEQLARARRLRPAERAS